MNGIFTYARKFTFGWGGGAFSIRLRFKQTIQHTLPPPSSTAYVVGSRMAYPTAAAAASTTMYVTTHIVYGAVSKPKGKSV